MTPAAIPSPTVAEIERLLAALAGVVGARVVANHSGRILEIHILSDPELHPKQVVRNVESALRAGLSIEVDRRVISVAQVSPADMPRKPELRAEPTMENELTFLRPGFAVAEPPNEQRLVFRGFNATADHANHITCTAVLADELDEFVGSGTGPVTPQGRCEAGARALIAALEHARGDDAVALEGVTLLEHHNRQLVLVSARAIAGRSTIPLAGVALVERSPEEAAILAALQATNRWMTRGEA